MKALFIGAALVFLTGCQSSHSDYTALRSEHTDDTYQRIDIPLQRTGPFTYVNRIPTYYKLFEHEGKLAVCGAYILTIKQTCNAALARRWYDGATFYANGKRIGPGEFFERSSPSDAGGPYDAQCVLTNETWQPSLAVSPRLSYQGIPVSVTCQLGSGFM